MIDEEALRSIEKLHEMKLAGVISEADFEQAKKDLLEGRGRTRTKTRTASTPPSETPALPADHEQLEWIIMPLRRYADFQGRSCRKEYWMFQLLVAVVVFVLAISLSDTSSLYRTQSGSAKLISGIAIIALLGLAVPSIAVQVRRFHDQDKSGWFALLNLVPYLGPFIIAGFMLIDGTPGDNQHGPDPKGR